MTAHFILFFYIVSQDQVGNPCAQAYRASLRRPLRPSPHHELFRPQQNRRGALSRAPSSVCKNRLLFFSSNFATTLLTFAHNTTKKYPENKTNKKTNIPREPLLRTQNSPMLRHCNLSIPFLVLYYSLQPTIFFSGVEARAFFELYAM